MQALAVKTAFVTGAAGGIGLAFAKALAGEGMNVALADIDEERVARSASEIAALGVHACRVKLDVSAFDGSDKNLAGWARKITGKTTMTVGSVGLEAPLGDETSLTGVTTENLKRLIEMVERGDFQIVGVGRALLTNPGWANIVCEQRWDKLRAYDASRNVEALG